jgi:hypothetical protein
MKSSENGATMSVGEVAERFGLATNVPLGVPGVALARPDRG